MNLYTIKALRRIRDPLWVKDAVMTARARTGGPNACAATLSQVLLDLRLIDKTYTWTADIVGTENRVGLLEVNAPTIRINHPSDVRAGDILVSRDRAGDDNDAPDHVYMAYGDPEGPRDNPFIQVIDNYCRNGKPYWRNLGKSGWHRGRQCAKTPMAYAIRFVENELISDDTFKKRVKIVELIHQIYDLSEVIPLDAKRYLNLFSNHTCFDIVRDK